jgi:hypothetical protein
VVVEPSSSLIAGLEYATKFSSGPFGSMLLFEFL